MTRKLLILVGFALLGSALLFGCGDSGVRSYDVPKESAPAAAGGGAPAMPGGMPSMPGGMPAANDPGSHGSAAGGALAWSVPPGWQVQESSGMRVASFAVPAAGEGAECYIVILEGQGGGEAANVNRWRRQLGMPPEPEGAIAAAGVSRTAGVGPYRYFRLVNDASPERAMLAAIVPLGPQTAFVKLVAPSDALDGVTPSFEKFCDSLHAD